VIHSFRAFSGGRSAFPSLVFRTAVDGVLAFTPADDDLTKALVDNGIVALDVYLQDNYAKRRSLVARSSRIDSNMSRFTSLSGQACACRGPTLSSLCFLSPYLETQIRPQDIQSQRNGGCGGR